MNLPALGPVVDRIWDLRATRDVLSADKNADYQLNQEEYQSVSQIKGDGLFLDLAKNYEFAVVDEIKLSDGQISISELSSFYKSMDKNADTEHSREEFATRLNESSWSTRLRHPVASFSQSISYYTGLASRSIGKMF